MAITHRHPKKEVLDEYCGEYIELICQYLNHFGMPLNFLHKLILEEILTKGYRIEEQENNGILSRLNKTQRKRRQERNIVGGLMNGKRKENVSFTEKRNRRN